MLNWLRCGLEGNDGAQIPKHDRGLGAAIGYLIRQFLVIVFESQTLTIKNQTALWDVPIPSVKQAALADQIALTRLRSEGCHAAAQSREMRFWHD